ncbi:MAG: hypothetical protein V3V92_00390 [Candidatus Hydrothermarchaeales archaeon]
MKLHRNLNTSDFTTDVVRTLNPQWSTNYINKSLHDLVKRGWAQRIKKGKFRLRDFDQISEEAAPTEPAINILLGLPHKEDFLITSYLASQFLTKYVNTTPRITLLCSKRTHQKLRDFLKAKAKAVDRNLFRLFKSNVAVNVIPVHPLKYKKLAQNSLDVSVTNRTFQVTGPKDTLKFLLKEKEDRRLADIAYLSIKFPPTLAIAEKTLNKADTREIKKMIEERKDALIESTPEEIIEMNLVAA